MTSVAYINGRVLTQGQLTEGLAIVVNGERIERLIRCEQAVAEGITAIDLDGKYVLPGFIDTQVNGGGGVLFNDSPDVAGVKIISEAHRQFGTTGLLPTLISDELDVIRQGVAAVDDAIDQGIPGVVGIHIEGPFLAHDRRGVHDARKLKQLTVEIINELKPVRFGRTVLTLAPETVSPDMIRMLTEKGFIVCAGHSNASHKMVSSAVQHGLRGFTHLFNAMSQLGSREPGMVGAALDEKGTWCGIIADNHHVSPVSLRVAYRCKGPEKLMLVTDAMPVVGSGQNTFSMMGKEITVSDRVCRDPDGTLAGTALDMASAVRNIIKDTGCSLADASCMASATPAAFLGLHDDRGAIEAGQRADLVITDKQINVCATMIGGKTVFSSQPV
jgi:N-acetylglucosamine-6-phosphate deacetylase